MFYQDVGKVIVFKIKKTEKLINLVQKVISREFYMV